MRGENCSAEKFKGLALEPSCIRCGEPLLHSADNFARQEFAGNHAAQKKIRLKGLAQNNEFELVAVGEKGCMMYSKDRGRTWKEFGDFTNVNLEAVSFKDNDTFFAVGADGRIFKFQF